MPEQGRTLTATEQAALTPLLQRRAVLQAEVAGLDAGLKAMVRHFAGEDGEGASLDLETMTLHHPKSPEDVAEEMREHLSVAGGSD